ncbi:MAG: leucine-rich repeat domain-containing protein [Paludibacteraceae bacterium]|nr:leucine-rich repeat domain-containing protein [Paludibacteraceae bacterium]
MKNIEIPSGVTSIGDGAFSGCDGLTHIEIPSGVTSIGDNAFMWCKNLEIVIDNSKENVKVGSDAFMGCKSVKFLK